MAIARWSTRPPWQPPLLSELCATWLSRRISRLNTLSWTEPTPLQEWSVFFYVYVEHLVAAAAMPVTVQKVGGHTATGG